MKTKVMMIVIVLCTLGSAASAQSLVRTEQTLANRIARTLAIQVDTIAEAWAYNLDADVALEIFNRVTRTLQEQASRSREFMIYTTDRAAMLISKLCQNKSHEYWNACRKGAAFLRHLSRQTDVWHQFLNEGVRVYKAGDPVYKAIIKTLSF